jgi:hypothetical protein
MHWRGLATFWFAEAGDVRVEPFADGLETTLHDIFVRGVIPVVLLARGYEAFHASAVVGPRGLIALCGVSGRGKSTLALALSGTGLQHFADDTIVYRVVDGTPTAIRLHFPVRVDDGARAVLPAPTDGVMSTSARAIDPPVRILYDLVRDETLDPEKPVFSPVPAERRFQLLLAHAHPFDMGPLERRRAFMEQLMAVARTIEVCECRFAPSLPALPRLAEAIRAHASPA